MVRRVVVVLSARDRPYEIALLGALFISTVVNLIVDPGPVFAAIVGAVPGYQWGWTAGVLLGSGVTLGAVFLEPPSSLLWERVGLSLVSLLCLSYGIAAVAEFGVSGWSGANLLLAVGVAGVFRMVRLTRDLRLLRGLPRR
jgi:hypothetical protein